MSAKLVRDVLQMPYWERRPAAGLRMHSNPDTPCASADYRKLLKRFQVTQSMSRKGNCWDNVPIESFLETHKVQHTSRLRYPSRDKARLDIVNSMKGFCHEKLLHAEIDC